ncbi:molecular chaperone HtpG [Endothiovibrio diazotrophicus]
MSVEAHKETLEFQTEVSQLLKLMIHSLYSNKEIFLRELISNASDACDKLRFEGLTDDALFEGDPELRVEVAFDKEARTVTVRDNGIGMNRQEVMDNIGTIAKSGTRQFFESLTGDQAKDAQLIGQFGVGFYSAFIVADKVTLTTRRAGLAAEHGVRWESAGEGSYSLETVDMPSRGTEVVLHLREDATEFAEDYRLRSIIRKYSDHISIPVQMMSHPMPPAEGEEAEEPKLETVNSASALWARPKGEISDDEYKEFYKHVGHDFDDPLLWLHNRVEGKQEYTSLLYLPKRAPFDLFDRERRHGIKLYVKRVFIMDDAEQLMPAYLRFVRGVIDSDDLPLNVSREILQHNKLIDGMRSASVKRVLDALEKMAKDDAEQYQSFWNEFGKVLKEGPAEDHGNRERIAKLLRFHSTNAEIGADSGDATVGLDSYIERMKEGQEKIYYVTADSLAAAKSSPHLEVFKKKGIEVLLLTDRVDEWMVSYLTEYEGKSLVSVAKGGLDLGELEDEEEKKAAEEAAEESKDILERMKTVLDGRVKEVRASHRLTDSPACVVLEAHEMAMHMQRLLKEAGHEMPSSLPILEVNPRHPLVERMKSEQDEDRFADWSHILFDQAMLAEGGQLEDPMAFVKRVNAALTAG